MSGPRSEKGVDRERADQPRDAFDARCPARRFQHSNTASHFGGGGNLRALPPHPTMDRRGGVRPASGLWQARTFRGSIAAELGRTPNQIMGKAALLGLRWPLECRANLGSKPALSDRQQAEARRRLAAGESA